MRSGKPILAKAQWANQGNRHQLTQGLAYWLGLFQNEAFDMNNSPVTGKMVLYQGIRDVLLSARTRVHQTVNTTMVQTYWQIGRLIV
jgi:hypothetical protein